MTRPTVGLKQIFLKPYSLRKYIALPLLLLVNLVGCSIKKPATETPTPKTGVFEKSFFINQDGKKSKTFLFGMATEAASGNWGEHFYMHNGLMAEHANIEFEITESNLIGKMINPSFPNDRTKWQPVMIIPIRRHFYIEKEKDSYGRDTNEIAENSSRSHWSARPYMELGLESITMLNMNWATGASWWRPRNGMNLVAEEIEHDPKNNFLGFSVTAVDPQWGSDASVKFRVNFMGFEHNEKFQKTALNIKNYNYLNILHYTGKLIDGSNPVYYAGHWDLTKNHNYYLVNVPEEYVDLVKDVVEGWNDTLKKIGALPEGVKGFIPVVQDLKHPYDLRYPGLYWVTDKRISMYSPLGVGQAHMDVRNGEMLWGGITIYGGEIERYIQSSLSPSQAIANGKIPSLKKMFAGLFDRISGSSSNGIIDSLNESAQSTSTRMSQDLMQKNLNEMKNSLQKNMLDMQAKLDAVVGANGKDNKQLQDFLATTTAKLNANKSESGKEPLMDEAKARMLVQSIQREHFNQTQQLRSRFGSTDSKEIYKKLFMNSLPPSEDDAASNSTEENSTKATPVAKKKTPLVTSPSFCGDRQFKDVALEWSAAAAQSGRDLKEVTYSILKDIFIHEYGHFLGMGHNFKENILPVQGSVPEKYRQGLVAQYKNGMKQYSTVMGYKNARTEMITTTEEIKPGPHDELVLRYLYNQQYPTFTAGAGDFEYSKVPEDGLIPAVSPKNPAAKTTFFLQCNDITASLGLDPFCNRWDRGSSAVEIVQNELDDLTKDLVKMLNAFTDENGVNSWYREWALWSKSDFHISRIRTFYDHMRRRYEKVIDTFRNREEALYEFAQCQGGEIKDPQLQKLFADYPELLDLCKANALALDGLKDIIEKDVPDFTKMDNDAYVLPGGISAGDLDDSRWNRANGTWKELGIFPMKWMALFGLMSPQPLNGYLFYSDPNYGYSYSSLYPFKFTESIASAVINNIRFASLGRSDTTRMGALVPTLGWMQYYHLLNNDAMRFPGQFITRLRNQNNLDFGYAVVLATALRKEDHTKLTKAFGFTGMVLDFWQNQKIAAEQVYVLPGGQLLVKAPGMFLLPLTKLTMYSDQDGYIIALKVSYSREKDDNRLSASGLRAKLVSEHEKVIEACVKGGGNQNGLMYYFSAGTEFAGFDLQPQAASDEIYQNFLKSINTEFNRYYTADKFKANPPKPETCTESLRGLGLIVSSAAASNGFWLPQTLDFLLK